MTFRELRDKTAPISAELRELRDFAEADEFAPWAVEALAQAAYWASLSDAAIREARERVEATVA